MCTLAREQGQPVRDASISIASAVAQQEQLWGSSFAEELTVILSMLQGVCLSPAFTSQLSG